jgi:hypothetical protein
MTLVVLSVVVFVNLTGFAADGLPKGWFKAGTHPQNYEMSTDTVVKHGGKIGARIKFTGANAEGFGTLMQAFKADDYRGKRVRMSAWMKTEDAESANLWLRVDGTNRTLGFDNMGNRAVRGTNEWKKYELTVDVPAEAVDIAFGAFAAGKGQVWVDDYSFEVVSQEVPSTNMLTPEQMKEEQGTRPAREYPKQPVNLDFES